jgi:alpha-1,3-rhamnosyl/mannosyltransferase
MLVRQMIPAVMRVQPNAEILLFSGENPGWADVDWRPAQGGSLIGETWRMVRGIARDIADMRPDVFWARSLHHADRRACVSAFTRARLVAHWPGLANRAEVVRHGASPPPKEEGVIASNRPYLLNVDTLEPRKNLSIVLDAIERLPEIHLVQCGNIGWGVSNLVERATVLPSVTLRGYVPDVELAALYRGAVAALFPSIYEGFHLPPLDAMSAGCPVIASDIPVHREVLGDAAVFVPCHDVDAWVAAIRQVLGDPQGRERMAAAGRERAAGFTWEKSARTLLRLFESVVRSDY